MDKKFRIYAANADSNPVDRCLAVRALRDELLPLLEPLVDDISKINIDVNAENHLLINGVAISNDFRHCSDFTNSAFPGYLIFNDNGTGKFVDMGAKPIEDADKVYEVFIILRSDERIKIIEYRAPERINAPRISPFAKPEEYDEVTKIIEKFDNVMEIIESEGIEE